MSTGVRNNINTRPSIGSPTVTSVTMKASTGKAEPKKQLSVDEELALAKIEAEESLARIAELETEKKKLEEQEAARKLQEQAEAEERKKFEAFKSFMANVGTIGPSYTEATIAEKTEVAPQIKEVVIDYKSEAKEPSGGLFGENTSYLIRVMGGTAVVLVVLYLAILSLFGKANDSVSLMTDSFPMRMYINLLIEVVAIGIGFIGLRLLFPEQYKYVHSKINSLCSPKQDWERSSPEFRLRFASEQLWRFAFLFVLALMVIFT